MENHELKFITSGQINIPTSIDTTGTPLPPYKTKPKIVKGYWSKDKHGVNQIKEAYLEDTVYFVIETFGIEDNKTLSVQLYDYDHFLWHDLWNIDDKIDNPREVKVKNNRAVIEVYLKPDWKKHIDEEKGWLSTDDAIELYWKISCSNPKISEKIFPQEIYNHLKVRNNRDIYIKPVMSETGYSYGVPEIYSFEGEPLMFEEIFDFQAIDENSDNLLKEYGKGILFSGALYTGDKGLSKAAKGMAIRKISKGYRINNAGKILYHDYFTFMKEERMLRTFLPAEMRSLRGIDQVSTMQKKLASTQTLYFIKNTADIFGSFSSLADLAAGGNDINSVMTDALGLLAKSSGVGILLSIFGKMMLDVMQTPVKEFFEEMRDMSVKEMNFEKFKGAENIRLFIQNDNFLRNIYFTDFIENETMQRLLGGQIKKQDNLKLGYGKVMVVYRKIDDGILIDSFFINTKEK